MLFRGWYRTCQIVTFGFPLVFLGFLFPSTTRISMLIGSFVIFPLGLLGGILGLIWTFKGLRSRCPLCGAVGYWIFPAKYYLAIECSNCGLVGGHVGRDLRYRVLSEFYDGETSDIAENEDG